MAVDEELLPVSFFPDLRKTGSKLKNSLLNPVNSVAG